MIETQRTREEWGLDATFVEFVRARSARLLRSAYLLTGDRAQAEDLVQVALVRTGRRWEAARQAPEAYAYAVLVNLARDRRRSSSRRVREVPLDTGAGAFTLGRQDSGVDPAAGFAERDAIIAAVRQLPARQREVLVLRFYAERSIAETAAAIGVSEGSVKTHTSRALARLRELLEDRDDANAGARPAAGPLCATNEPEVEGAH